MISGIFLNSRIRALRETLTDPFKEPYDLRYIPYLRGIGLFG